MSRHVRKKIKKCRKKEVRKSINQLMKSMHQAIWRNEDNDGIQMKNGDRLLRQSKNWNLMVDRIKKLDAVSGYDFTDEILEIENSISRYLDLTLLRPLITYTKPSKRPNI